MTTDIYCAECGLVGECECGGETMTDPFAALDRRDLEMAISVLRDLAVIGTHAASYRRVVPALEAYLAERDRAAAAIRTSMDEAERRAAR